MEARGKRSGGKAAAERTQLLPCKSRPGVRRTEKEGRARRRHASTPVHRRGAGRRRKRTSAASIGTSLLIPDSSRSGDPDSAVFDASVETVVAPPFSRPVAVSISEEPVGPQTLVCSGWSSLPPSGVPWASVASTLFVSSWTRAVASMETETKITMSATAPHFIIGNAASCSVGEAKRYLDVDKQGRDGKQRVCVSVVSMHIWRGGRGKASVSGRGGGSLSCTGT